MNIVDKAEYRIKLEQINNLAENGDFKGAAAIADTIEWKRVKSVRTLCMIGEIYEANRRYSDSEQILKYAYRQSSTSKTVLYRLAEIEIRMGFYDEAKKYYQEFEELSPHDTSRYILKYKLLRAQGAPLSEQIEVLREYKEREYTERWAFELARLYKKNGQKQRCIEECDDMILWFAEGKYVTRAMELKMQLEPLSEAQQKRYDNRHKAAIEAERRAIPDDDLNGFDRVQRAINRADEEDYELRPERQKKVTAAEAIQKMNAAADEAVTTAIFEEKTPNVRPGIRTGRGIGRSSDIQDQIASSFREAVSSIRKPRQIDYTDLYSEEEEPGEDFKESFEESREDRGNAELEALFAETGSMFAKELADTFGVRSGSAFEIEKDEEIPETETPEEPEAVTAEEETAADQAESSDVTEEAEEAKAENESAGETEESFEAPPAEEICEDQAEVSEAAENEESEAAEAEDDAASETEEQETPESFEDIESGTAAEEAEDASSDEEIAEKPEYDITEPEIEGSFADLADTLEPVDPTEAAGMIEEIDRSLVEGVDEDFDLSSLTEDEDITEDVAEDDDIAENDDVAEDEAVAENDDVAEDEDIAKNDDVAEDEDVADHTEETVETAEEAAETAAGDIDEAAENIQDDIEETAEAIEDADEEPAEAEAEAEEIAEAIEEADEEAAEAEAEEAEETAEAIEETAEESDDVAVEAEAEEAEETAEAIEEVDEEAAEAEAEAEEIAEAIEEADEEAAEAEAEEAEETAEAIEESEEEAAEAEAEAEGIAEAIEESEEETAEAEAEEAEEIAEAVEEAIEAEEEVEEITEAFEEATEEAAETDLESADDTAEAEEEAADSDAGTAFYKPEEPTAEESVEPILGTEEIEEITAGDSDDADIPCEKRSSNEFVQEEEIPDSGSIDSAEDAEFDEEYYEPYDLEAEAEALREFGEAFSEIEKEAAEISENAAESQPFTPSEKIGEVIAPIIYDSENAAEEAAVREELKAEAEELTKADEVFAEELAEAGEVFTEELTEAGNTYTEALEKADDVLVKELEKADDVLVRELPLADDVFTKELADAKETLAEDSAEEIAAEEPAEAEEIEELTAEEPAEAEEAEEASAEESVQAEVTEEMSAEEPAEAEATAEEPAQAEVTEETSAEEPAEAEEAIAEEPAEPEAAEETESEKAPESASEEPSESAEEAVPEEKPYVRKIRPVTEESVVQEIAEGTQDVLEETVPEAVWASLSRRMASAVERMSARTASAMAWDKETDSYNDEELLSTIEPEEESEPAEQAACTEPGMAEETEAALEEAVEEESEPTEGLTKAVPELAGESAAESVEAVEETAEEIIEEGSEAVEAAEEIGDTEEETTLAEEFVESILETEAVEEIQPETEMEEILEESSETPEETFAEAAETAEEIEDAAEAAENDAIEETAEELEEPVAGLTEEAVSDVAVAVEETMDEAEAAVEAAEAEEITESASEVATEEVEELEEAEEAAEEIDELEEAEEAAEEFEEIKDEAEDIEEIEDTVVAAEEIEEIEDTVEAAEAAEETADAAENEEISEEAEESADAADEAEQADVEVSELSADEILKSMEVPTAGVDPEELWRPVVSPEETETLLGRETDESLGLTREFNFQEELRKARAGDITLEEAAKLVYEKAEAEADSTREGKTEHTAFFLSPEEEARKTVMEAAGKEFPVAEPEEEDMTPVPEEPVKIEEEPEEPKVSIKKESAPIPIGEIPKEIFADESDESLPDEAAEDVSDILSAEEGSFGRDTNIIEHIMTEPEMVNRVPVLPRKFDETERKIFSYFSNIPGMQEQITLALADIHNNSGDKTSRSGNVLIIGRQKSGKTKLAEGIMLAVCKDLHIQAAKRAKIIATDLNKKDPAKIVKLLAGGFLLIEGAGSMYDETIEKLSKAMEFRTDGLVVILEDEKRDMRAMLNSHPELAEKFTSTIIVPVFTNDELVTFARTYARENGYKFDELATLALYTLIGDNQKDSEPMTVGMVKELVDQAIDHSKSRRFGFRSKNQSTPDGRILLREKDFS